MQSCTKLPPPKENGKSKHEAEDSDDDDKTTNTRHNRRHKDPTETPTYYPTFEPTSTPSESPSTTTPLPTVSPRIYDLVFSDEFNVPHRTFHDGSDPRWTAIEKNDYTNDAQHYYSGDNVYTDTHGNLIIKSEAADTTIIGFNDVKYKKERVTKHFKSAMIQSWRLGQFGRRIYPLVARGNACNGRSGGGGWVVVHGTYHVCMT